MFYAHTSGERVQSVKEHLVNTANLSAAFAAEFGCGELAYACGLLHDVGKYSDAFQSRITHKSSQSVDHATAGGQLAFHTNGEIGDWLPTV